MNPADVMSEIVAAFDPVDLERARLRDAERQLAPVRDRVRLSAVTFDLADLAEHGHRSGVLTDDDAVSILRNCTREVLAAVAEAA